MRSLTHVGAVEYALRRMSGARRPWLIRSAATALGLVALVRPCAAATALFIDSDPGDRVGQGRQRSHQPPAFEISASTSSPSQITLNVIGPQYQDNWSLTFAAPAGTPLVAGRYENAQTYPYQNFDRPGFLISTYNAYCSRVSGRFEILAAEFAQGQVREFVATFEQHCESATPKLSGVIRFSAGDPACANAADGTTCDDHDACTPSPTCLAGQCVGQGAAACSPATSECEDPGVCSPTSGVCLPPSTRPDSAICDDGDACSLDDRCQQGICGGASFTYCPNDGDPCTEDLCEPSLGCTSRPANGICGRPGVPSTLLFIQTDPDTPNITGRQLSLTTADGDLSVTNSPEGFVYVVGPGNISSPYLNLTFAAPGGQRLQAGTYEPAREYVLSPAGSPAAILSVSGLGYCASSRSGTFTVIEAGYTPGGRLEMLAVDFSLRCPDTSSGVRGALRFRAGDATCHDAPDGTPCDDRNACTAASACLGGACVAPETTACAPGDACRQAGVCDPSTGACLVPIPKQDQTSCQDEAACIPSGYCQAGACVGFGTPCDDGDLCTEDRCDAGQCVATPIVGRCWTVDGMVSVQWSSNGKRCSCTERAIPEPLVLYDEGGYRIPVHGGICEPTLETGTWSRKRTGRLTFAPGNDVAELIGGCGNVLDLRKYAISGKLLRRGGALSLRRVRKYTVGAIATGGARKIAITLVAHLKGHPTDTARVPDYLPVPPTTARCQEKLYTCLFGTPSSDDGEEPAAGLAPSAP